MGLSGTSLTTYEQMRDEVRRIVSARAGLDSLKDDAVPMEVDAVFKGKGKDKGKDKTQKYFDGKCRWCGRQGHREDQCMFKQKYEDGKKTPKARASPLAVSKTAMQVLKTAMAPWTLGSSQSSLSRSMA